MQKVTIKALFQQSFADLEEQHGLKANFPLAEGETWSFAAIDRIKGRIDNFVFITGCPLTADEISEILYWEAELLELDPSYSREEIETYKARKKVFDDFVSKLGDQ